jgi:hypothetical protein
MHWDISEVKFIISFSEFLPIYHKMTLLGGLSQSSGGRIWNFTLSISFDNGSK